MTTTEKTKAGNIAEAVNAMTTDERERVMLFVNGMIAMKSLMNEKAASDAQEEPQDERKEEVLS